MREVEEPADPQIAPGRRNHDDPAQKSCAVTDLRFFGNAEKTRQTGGALDPKPRLFSVPLCFRVKNLAVQVKSRRDPLRNPVESPRDYQRENDQQNDSARARTHDGSS